MAYLLFIDESGHDLRASPYEVLAGVTVADKDLWNLITTIQRLETEHFGQRITEGALELKAKKLLKRKTFRLADQMPAFDRDDRAQLAKACLAEGAAAQTEQRQAKPTRRQLTALGQAKIAFVTATLQSCAQFHVRAFASIVARDAPRARGSFLRKDYAYLFERFFYFLQEQPGSPQGLIVFDEMEKARSHILVDQMRHYFVDTATGRWRSSQVVPEPFFVHSDLTTLIQVADLVAYIIAWGVRVGGMDPTSARPELTELARAVQALRHRSKQDRGGQSFDVWSFAVIDDLRPRSEKDDGG
jgi:hypothetical protein